MRRIRSEKYGPTCFHTLNVMDVEYLRRLPTRHPFFNRYATTSYHFSNFVGGLSKGLEDLAISLARNDEDEAWELKANGNLTRS